MLKCFRSDLILILITGILNLSYSIKANSLYVVLTVMNNSSAGCDN